MADSAAGSSRSKRRRRANNRKRAKDTPENAEVTELSPPSLEEMKSENEEEDVVNKRVDAIVTDNYRVESPQTVNVKDNRRNGTVVKSRSLDDEESVRITELSESSDGDDKTECSAIVAEEDSDVEWEITEELKLEEPKNALSLDLQRPKVEQTSHISPQEERNLRDFLEGINLTTCPIKAAAGKTPKTKRLKKREELAQYFVPVYHNPRYLDAISEESSDLSDREQQVRSFRTTTRKCLVSEETGAAAFRSLSQACRMLLNEDAERATVIVNDAQRHSVQMVTTPIVRQDVCTTGTAQVSSVAEIVVLEESSSNESSESREDADDEDSVTNKSDNVEIAKDKNSSPQKVINDALHDDTTRNDSLKAYEDDKKSIGEEFAADAKVDIQISAPSDVRNDALLDVTTKYISLVTSEDDQNSISVEFSANDKLNNQVLASSDVINDSLLELTTKISTNFETPPNENLIIEKPCDEQLMENPIKEKSSSKPQEPPLNTNPNMEKSIDQPQETARNENLMDEKPNGELQVTVIINDTSSTTETAEKCIRTSFKNDQTPIINENDVDKPQEIDVSITEHIQEIDTTDFDVPNSKRTINMKPTEEETWVTSRNIVTDDPNKSTNSDDVQTILVIPTVPKNTEEAVFETTNPDHSADEQNLKPEETEINIHVSSKLETFQEQGKQTVINDTLDTTNADESKIITQHLNFVEPSVTQTKLIATIHDQLTNEESKEVTSNIVTCDDETEQISMIHTVDTQDPSEKSSESTEIITKIVSEKPLESSERLFSPKPSEFSEETMSQQSSEYTETISKIDSEKQSESPQKTSKNVSQTPLDSTDIIVSQIPECTEKTFGIVSQQSESIEETVSHKPSEFAERIVSQKPSEFTKRIVSEKPLTSTNENITQKPSESTRKTVCQEQSECTETASTSQKLREITPNVKIVPEKPSGSSEKILIFERPSELTINTSNIAPSGSKDRIVSQKPTEYPEIKSKIGSQKLSQSSEGTSKSVVEIISAETEEMKKHEEIKNQVVEPKIDENMEKPSEIGIEETNSQSKIYKDDNSNADHEHSEATNKESNDYKKVFKNFDIITEETVSNIKRQEFNVQVKKTYGEDAKFSSGTKSSRFEKAVKIDKTDLQKSNPVTLDQFTIKGVDVKLDKSEYQNTDAANLNKFTTKIVDVRRMKENTIDDDKLTEAIKKLSNIDAEKIVPKSNNSEMKYEKFDSNSRIKEPKGKIIVVRNINSEDQKFFSGASAAKTVEKYSTEINQRAGFDLNKNVSTVEAIREACSEDLNLKGFTTQIHSKEDVSKKISTRESANNSDEKQLSEQDNAKKYISKMISTEEITCKIHSDVEKLGKPDIQIVGAKQFHNAPDLIFENSSQNRSEYAKPLSLIITAQNKGDDFEKPCENASLIKQSKQTTMDINCTTKTGLTKIEGSDASNVFRISDILDPNFSFNVENLDAEYENIVNKVESQEIVDTRITSVLDTNGNETNRNFNNEAKKGDFVSETKNDNCKFDRNVTTEDCVNNSSSNARETEKICVKTTESANNVTKNSAVLETEKLFSNTSPIIPTEFGKTGVLSNTRNGGSKIIITRFKKAQNQNEISNEETDINKNVPIQTDAEDTTFGIKDFKDLKDTKSYENICQSVNNNCWDDLNNKAFTQEKHKTTENSEVKQNLYDDLNDKNVIEEISKKESFESSELQQTTVENEVRNLRGFENNILPQKGITRPYENTFSKNLQDYFSNINNVTATKERGEKSFENQKINFSDVCGRSDVRNKGASCKEQSYDKLKMREFHDHSTKFGDVQSDQNVSMDKKSMDFAKSTSLDEISKECITTFQKKGNDITAITTSNKTNVVPTSMASKVTKETTIPISVEQINVCKKVAKETIIPITIETSMLQNRNTGSKPKSKKEISTPKTAEVRTEFFKDAAISRRSEIQEVHKTGINSRKSQTSEITCKKEKVGNSLINPKDCVKEKIIPITIVRNLSTQHSNSRKQSKETFADNRCSNKTTIIPITMEKNGSRDINLIKMDGDVGSSSKNKVHETFIPIRLEKEDLKGRETIIPIKIEKEEFRDTNIEFKDKNIAGYCGSTREEHIIPILMDFIHPESSEMRQKDVNTAACSEDKQFKLCSQTKFENTTSYSTDKKDGKCSQAKVVASYFEEPNIKASSQAKEKAAVSCSEGTNFVASAMNTNNLESFSQGIPKCTNIHPNSHTSIKNSSIGTQNYTPELQTHFESAKNTSLCTQNADTVRATCFENDASNFGKRVNQTESFNSASYKNIQTENFMVKKISSEVNKKGAATGARPKIFEKNSQSQNGSFLDKRNSTGSKSKGSNVKRNVSESKMDKSKYGKETIVKLNCRPECEADKPEKVLNFFKTPKGTNLKQDDGNENTMDKPEYIFENFENVDQKLRCNKERLIPVTIEDRSSDNAKSEKGGDDINWQKKSDCATCKNIQTENVITQKSSTQTIKGSPGTKIIEESAQSQNTSFLDKRNSTGSKRKEKYCTTTQEENDEKDKIKTRKEVETKKISKISKNLNVNVGSKRSVPSSKILQSVEKGKHFPGKKLATRKVVTQKINTKSSELCSETKSTMIEKVDEVDTKKSVEFLSNNNCTKENIIPLCPEEQSENIGNVDQNIECDDEMIIHETIKGRSAIVEEKCSSIVDRITSAVIDGNRNKIIGSNNERIIPISVNDENCNITIERIIPVSIEERSLDDSKDKEKCPLTENIINSVTVDGNCDKKIGCNTERIIPIIVEGRSLNDQKFGDNNGGIKDVEANNDSNAQKIIAGDEVNILEDNWKIIEDRNEILIIKEECEERRNFIAHDNESKRIVGDDKMMKNETLIRKEEKFERKTTEINRLDKNFRNDQKILAEDNSCRNVLQDDQCMLSNDKREGTQDKFKVGQCDCSLNKQLFGDNSSERVLQNGLKKPSECNCLEKILQCQRESSYDSLSKVPKRKSEDCSSGGNSSGKDSNKSKDNDSSNGNISGMEVGTFKIGNPLPTDEKKSEDGVFNNKGKKFKDATPNGNSSAKKGGTFIDGLYGVNSSRKEEGKSRDGSSDSLGKEGGKCKNGNSLGKNGRKPKNGSSDGKSSGKKRTKSNDDFSDGNLSGKEGKISKDNASNGKSSGKKERKHKDTDFPNLESQGEEIQYDESFKKVFKEVLQEQRNVVGSRGSSSSSSETSVGTTQCTVRRNPMVSSIGDVESLIEEMENLKEEQGFDPDSLKDACVRTLMALPFGTDVLEELAEVSQSLEELTDKLPRAQFHIKNEINEVFTLPAGEGMAKPEDWVGLPTEGDPKVLVCLSPTQKEFLDKTRPVPAEADRLLELHEKFVNRRSYDDTTGNENRLLTIMREQVVEESSGLKRWKSSTTLPRRDASESAASGANAHLSEWLQLARGPQSVNTGFDTGRVGGQRVTPGGLPHRRYSLPHELYVLQMQHLIEKEKQIQHELEQLEDEKRKLMCATTATTPTSRDFQPDDYRISKNGDVAVLQERPHEEHERRRREMYDEYMKKIAAREARKQSKVIKISMHSDDTIESKHNDQKQSNNDIENEFMDKVKKRKRKYGLTDGDDDDVVSEEVDGRPVLIVDGDAVSEATALPKHLREFVEIAEDGVWSPGQRISFDPEDLGRQTSQESVQRVVGEEEGIPPVWIPRSAGSSPTAERKEFRPVNFESPVLGRKARTKSDGSANLTQANPPWKASGDGAGNQVQIEKRLPTSFSAPGPGFSDTTSRLPRAQNPTITLLQKAREGQIPKGAAYIEQERTRRKNESPHMSSSDIVYQIRTESMSDSDSERPKKTVTIRPKKYEGIGPTTKDGMPIILRSEVRDSNMSQWYKKMYETIHKQRPSRYDDDEYVMVRYKQRRARYPYAAAGYLSEPEPGAYDSDATLSDGKYSTLDRRRPASVTVNNGSRESDHTMSSTLPRSSVSTTTISYRPDVQHTNETYKNQPGRIENYTPGQSSISEKEAKKWWDEVMDIFDGWLEDHSALPSYNCLLNKAIVRSHLEQQKRVPQTKGYMSQALKESGYESDSTLVFRRRDDTAQQLSPMEQKEVYKNIQKGGDVPLHGLRKPAPERPKDDADVEYFPISPTLNRIRVHRSPRDFFCYPVNLPPHPPDVFAAYKRSAPSTLIVPRKPPSPPRRRSSRNNSTLRLISTLKVRPEKSSSGKRHETCFVSSPVQKSNVKYLREKISGKLTPPGVRKVTKATEKGAKRCCGRHTKPCRSCSLSVPRKLERSTSPVKERPSSADRTFGMAKKSIDLQLPKLHEKRVKSLKFPADVKNVSSSSPELMAKSSDGSKDVGSLGRRIATSPKLSRNPAGKTSSVQDRRNVTSPESSPGNSRSGKNVMETSFRRSGSPTAIFHNVSSYGASSISPTPESSVRSTYSRSSMSPTSPLFESVKSTRKKPVEVTRSRSATSPFESAKSPRGRSAMSPIESVKLTRGRSAESPIESSQRSTRVRSAMSPIESVKSTRGRSATSPIQYIKSARSRSATSPIESSEKPARGRSTASPIEPPGKSTRGRSITSSTESIANLTRGRSAPSIIDTSGKSTRSRNVISSIESVGKSTRDRDAAYSIEPFGKSTRGRNVTSSVESIGKSTRDKSASSSESYTKSTRIRSSSSPIECNLRSARSPIESSGRSAHGRHAALPIERTVTLTPTTSHSQSTVDPKYKGSLKSTIGSSERATRGKRESPKEFGSNLTRSRSATSPTSITMPSPKSSKSASLDSLKSPKVSKSLVKIVKPVIPKDKKLKKSKKDQLNVEIVKRSRNKDGDSKKKINGKKTTHAKDVPPITREQIHRQKELVQGDSFFQHLFLRDLPSPTFSSTSRGSWIHEKTQALMNRISAYVEPKNGALRIYLNHTKPVSESKFKSLDAAMRSRSVSPKTVTWKNSIINDQRSVSLPPKLIFSQTSRPVTPVVERRKVNIPPKTHEVLSKIVLTQTSRPVSPMFTKPKTLITFCRGESPSDKLYFSETSRPVSPVVGRKEIPRDLVGRKTPEKVVFSETSRPISPIIQGIDYSVPKTLRSPSCRKIKSRQIDAKKKHEILHFDPGLYRSTSSLDSFDSGFPGRPTRFKELNKFYADLERLGELERTTSSSDLHPRKRHEDEIIDYERWQEVRTRERAERELKSLYKQLKDNQKEKDFLFRTKDVDAYRWRKDLDRGLRIKEKSVENIREEFERIKLEEAEKEAKLREEMVYTRGVYKPLWRGNSVVNLAHVLNERRSQSEGRVVSARQKIIDSERLLTHGIGSRIWSSLSMEQVNILKNQLSEIYGNDSKFAKPDKCGIEVSLTRDAPPSGLRVRRNSDSSKTSPLMDRKEAMSEVDKRKISQSLSKEVLERQRKKYKTSLSLVLGKETRGAVAAADANIPSVETQSPRTCYSLEMSEDDQRNKENDFVLVLTKDDTDAHKNNVNETLEIWAQPKKPLVKTDALSKPTSISETESGSTDGSMKTVIFAGSKEKIQEKVDYFEHITDRNVYTPTVYKPAESSTYDIGDTIAVSPKLHPEKKYLSQSYQDLKELFGEQELMKMTMEPLSASRTFNYTPPPSPKLRSKRDVYRSRSLSPFYDDSYSSLRLGDVSRLKNKFENVGDFYSYRYGLRPRRCSSDPQLLKTIHIPGQQHGDVDSLRLKFEYPTRAGRGRSRYRRGGIVSPLWLRAEDRFMPHINIISKIASLCPKKPTSPENNRSSEELASILGIPVGEVEKLRQRFDSPERMSILGQMFTSSPNINELRDIAQYLTGSWTAHKYPKVEDNARSLSSPEQIIRNGSIVRKKTPRPKSMSPIRNRVKLSSILKTKHQTTPKRFDPNVHKPVARYQPPPPKVEWKPSVTFKEPEAPPPPPPKGHYEITESSPESPRKYVENEVTIHYRTPVRREVKEVLGEDELARRQADAMRKIYEEERRRKYLQVSHSDNELHDMNSRRHTDNFIPSQKSPIPLNRYDDFLDELSPRVKPRPRSPEPRLVARALYNFVGQTSRELTFRKGDVIYIRRQVDKNWYEGEINAMVGLFPANYVEIVPYDGIKSTPRKPHEGQARAKYNFIAQTHLELSLAKGELVVVTRRVDDNWFEGKIGGRKGIFPVSYVEILVDPSDAPPSAPAKPVASPAAHSMLLNGSSGGKESMGSHNYVPTFPTQDLGMSYRAKPIQVTGGGSAYGSLKKNPVDQALHIETQSEPIPYRALYKYRPQNEDELELLEGDTVYVLEKCDDGWYVGSSERTGAFGTFPGNYVERI